MPSPLPRERVEGDAGVDVAGAHDADVDAAVELVKAELGHASLMLWIARGHPQVVGGFHCLMGK